MSQLPDNDGHDATGLPPANPGDAPSAGVEAAESSPPPSKLRKWIGGGVVLFIFFLAMSALYRQAQHWEWAKIKAGLLETPLWALAAAVVLSALNYVVLIAYDVLAIRYVGYPIKLSKIAFGSFVAYVCSNNFGFVLGGSAVRYRFYSIWGMTGPQILKLLAMIGITFWVGLCAVAGLVFILQPLHVPDVLLKKMPEALQHFIQEHSVSTLGWLLVAGSIAYMGACALWRRPLRFGRWEVPLPPFGLAIQQLFVASLDFVLASGILYVLLPADVGIGFPQFVVVYLLSLVVAVSTHVPAGLGVFELGIMTLLGRNDEAVVSAIVLYRLAYYVLPLVVGGTMLMVHEYRLNRHLLEDLFPGKGKRAGSGESP